METEEPLGAPLMAHPTPLWASLSPRLSRNTEMSTSLCINAACSLVFLFSYTPQWKFDSGILV